MANVLHFVGLDLGQCADYTALAVLERPQDVESPPVYALRHLERIPLGTSYPAVVERVLTLLKLPQLADVTLIVDQTGVGRPVVDMLADALAKLSSSLDFFPVTITGGQAASMAPDGSLHVPKKDLVGTLQVLLQQRRLQIARTLPFAETLVAELQNFRVKITAAANETYEAWREGEHDDLVLAVALAAWVGEMIAQAPGRNTETELVPVRTGVCQW